MKEINVQLTNVHKAKALAQSKADGKGKKKVGKVLKVDSAKDDYGWYLYHRLHLQHACTHARTHTRTRTYTFTHAYRHRREYNAGTFADSGRD